MSLAVSMTDPPPTARKASGWYGLANAMASLILFKRVRPIVKANLENPTYELSFGSILHLSKTVYSIPSLVNPSSTCFIAFRLRTVLSVTTQTLLAPMF